MDLFKEKVLQAIEICNLELTDRKNGIEGESTIEQLEGVIITELKQVVDRINSQQLPQRDERYFNSFAKTNRTFYLVVRIK